MRLQLRTLRRPSFKIPSRLVGAGVAALCLAVTVPSRAQVARVDTAHTFYHEAPTRTNMTVYTPGVDIAFVDPPYAMTRGDEGPRNVRRLLDRLVYQELLAPAAYAVVRHEAEVDLAGATEAYEIEDRRTYGGMGFTIFFRQAGRNA